MPKLKTAKIRIAAIYIDCPTDGCGGGIEGTDGSFMLTRETMPNNKIVAYPATYQCGECKQTFKLPAKFWTLRNELA